MIQLHSSYKLHRATTAHKEGGDTQIAHRVKHTVATRDPYEVRRRIIFSQVSVYHATYNNGKGPPLTIRILGIRPANTRTIAGKKYTLTGLKRGRMEVIIMARTTAKNKSKQAVEIEDSELDELEALEELDDLEDEDTDDDETSTDLDDDDDDEDDEDDEDEAPPVKAKRTKASTKPVKSNTTPGKIGTAQLAENLGVDGRTLRMVLRKHKVEKDPETNRYEWDSMKDPTVKQITKWIKAGEHKEITKAALDTLKEKKAAEKAARKDEAPAAKGKKNKKSKKVVEVDEDDE